MICIISIIRQDWTFVWQPWKNGSLSVVDSTVVAALSIVRYVMMLIYDRFIYTALSQHC
jgi:hypothetical protein